MKEPRVEAIRNVALISATGAGKTSLLESLLYTAGVIPSMGSVAQGTTVSDFEPEEIHRKVSISSAVAHFTWKDGVFNLIDTPGATSFFGETRAALRAVDGFVLVIGASSGVRSEVETLLSDADDLCLPGLLFINELDKERTDFWQVLEDCQKSFGRTLLPVTIPIGSERELEGVVDVIHGASFRSAKDNVKVQPGSVPEGMEAAVADARKRLAEGVAEFDDRLLERYLAEGDLSSEELIEGLRSAVRARKCLPVYCGSAIQCIGIGPLLEAMASYLPSPKEHAALKILTGTNANGEPVARQADEREPFSGFVFKTIIDPFVGRLSYVRVLSGRLDADSPFYNATRHVKEKGGHLFTIVGKKYVQVPAASVGDIVAIGKLKDTQTGDTICDEHHPVCYAGLQLPRPVMSFALEPKSKADIEKVSLGLHKLVEEDPTLEFVRNQETKEMIVSGMGQLHVDVTFEKLRRKYGAEVIVHTPKVPYKETIRKMAQAQGKYKKQTGGHGQYGDCWLQLDPLPRGKGFEFVNQVVGGVIPRNFIPAVEKGVIEAMQEGILAGFPVVDVRATVYDGSYHTVDSSELSFKIAASMAFKKAMEAASPVLLEPMMTVEVAAPDEVIGAVIGDLNARRGRILGVSAKGNTEIIKAHVPLAEMLKYATSLNAITGGRGSYSMEFASYEEVPRDLAARVIEEQKAAKQAVAH
ncbi:elongation factor G [Candidatus Nitrospira bockiana]